MLAWVDGTRETIAFAIADYFDTPGRHFVAEGSRRFQIDWVPGQLDESFS